VALEFLTGYIVEESLSLDNMFVFVLVFGHFGIPARYHHRVLFYGILGALLFRAIFIALGRRGCNTAGRTFSSPRFLF
jgi:tellurite resistance protein TerC